jgi:septum formation topological specificity factor MinE
LARDELVSLLAKFVNMNSDVVDVQWDRRMSPRLLLNPYSENFEEQKRVAHYFLLVSSVLEDAVVGFSENARMLLIHLHKAFGNRLFEIIKPHLFEEKIRLCKFYGTLGTHKEMISQILTSVNKFVKVKAEKNLIKYSQKFSKPECFVEDLAQNVDRMSAFYKDKAWVYMRWMVRPHPDLEIFKHFSPEDLYVPLTENNANVAASLGLINSVRSFLWKNDNAAQARRRITSFAKQLYPKDPSKVDYPFFLLGRWLKKKPLNNNTLKEALQFFEHIHGVTGQPHAYYQSMSRYKSGWEKKTAITLSRMKISFGYEPIDFPLPGDNYIPDFILDKSIYGRKIVLEPHYEMTKKQARKYSLFKQIYGHDFFLILLLKNDLIPYYHKRNILTDDVCDDVWPIEFVHLLAEEIRTGTYGH